MMSIRCCLSSTLARIDSRALDREMATHKLACSGALGAKLRRLVLVILTFAAFNMVAQAATPRPPGYFQAEQAFEGLSPNNRILFQILMTATGQWNAVPNEAFSGRLFQAIRSFQTEKGMDSSGVPDGQMVERLLSTASPIMANWGFQKITHPTRPVTIWVPLGLPLSISRNKSGLEYRDQQKRLTLDFTTVPNFPVARNFAAIVAQMISDGSDIHYKVIKDDWFAISVTTRDGIDGYLRYHQDGPNVTGFTLMWDNRNGVIFGERIAVIMSGSLWSNMTGAAFIDPPSGRFSPPAKAPQEVVARPSIPEQPREENKFSSGSGFFVTGSDFITNAHVVKGCTQTRIKTVDGTVRDANIAARDEGADLALLRLSGSSSSKVAQLRSGLRLGESVAAFGFPHADILSSSGNFTLGNITALTGMNDDTREIQISAPVQSGNSGGPLLDQTGNVVGVVTGKLNAMKMANASGDLPQNVNFAIKASILASFLESNRVEFKSGVIGTMMQPPDIADVARNISGFVMCR